MNVGVDPIRALKQHRGHERARSFAGWDADDIARLSQPADI